MIVNRLPHILVDHNMSVLQLSEEIGVAYSTVYGMVKQQRRSVQLDLLDAICRRLGVQPGDIYQYVDEGGRQ